MHKLMTLAVLAALAAAQLAFGNEPAATRIAFDIRAQPLTEALDDLSHQAGVQVLHRTTESGEEPKTRSVQGALSVQQALEQMLAGTGYQYEFVNQQTVRVWLAADQAKKPGLLARRSPGDETSSQSASRGSAGSEDTSLPKRGERDGGVEEVVITGTHIRGAQLSSPALRIDRDDMRFAGQADLGEVIRSLPQNFSGGQNPGVALGAADGSIANQNLTGSSGLNLRGLGPDATLTLINGRRLPYDSFVQAMDISVIPAAAVDRLEVLLDGASSIYGSDAVGGVANVVLKKDYAGAEISVRHGYSTDGGNDQAQYTALAGSSWNSGGFLVAADASRNSPVRAGERSYLADMPNSDVIVYPRLDQKTLLVNGHQSLGGGAQITLAAYHAKRETNLFAQTAVKFFRDTDTTSWGVLPGFSFALPADWSLDLEGAFGRNESDSSLPIFLLNDTFLFEQRTCYCNEGQSADLRAEGPVFSVAGRSARLSLGAGYLRNTFQSINLLTGDADTSGSSRSRHAYGELYLPLLENLSFNAAARYEHYDTFGSVTTPKLGAVWAALPSLQLRASWGKSFKVPTLNEQFQPTILNLNSATAEIPGAAPASTYLLAIGGNRGLGPERAESTSAGVTIYPAALPGLKVDLGWFDIDYADRVVAPLGGAVDINAPEFVIRNPTLAQQNGLIATADQFPNFSGAPYDPTTVIAAFDNRFTNASAQKTHGVDLALEYRTAVNDWDLATRGTASWLTSERKNTSLSPETRVAGVVFFPPRFHGRASMIWQKSGLALAAHVDHIGGADNIYAVPRQRVSAMTTVDFVVDYQADWSLIGEMGLSLSALNAFDRRPPYMQPTNSYFVSYDSTNYSPLGRVLTASITKFLR